MKQILLGAFLFITITAFSQTDSTKKDSAKPVQQYALILNEQEITGLFNLIKQADEKPSIINAWLNFLQTKIQVLQPPPNKEKPKK